MTKLYFAAKATMLLLFTAFFANAQPPTISYQSVAAGFTGPVDVITAEDGSNRLFIVQQNGVIRIREGSAPFTVSVFMDLGTSTGSGLNLIVTGGEQGLLSMVFHPDYNGTTVPYFYLYYTNTAGNIEITRFETQAGPGTPSVLGNTNPANRLTIMTIPHPGETNHNGGKLIFGSDGYLYFGTGDGGGANDVPNNAQTGTNLLGKMIRIDVNNPMAQAYGNYRIPAGNPYIGDASVLDEIWALGLRNPFRWSFDRQNGNMWIGDVGQTQKEEVSFRAAGSTGQVNYGWRCYEGTISTPGVPDCTPPDNVFPVFEYDNPNGGASPSSAVTGGYVYRGTEYPNFRGYYVAADFYSGVLYFLWSNGSGGFNSSSQTTGIVTFISGFGEGEDGTLYAVSQSTGTLYKLVATGGTPLPVTLSSFVVNRLSGYNELKWTTSSEQNTSKFIIEFSVDGRSFNSVGQVDAGRNINGSNYSFRHNLNVSYTVYYRLAIHDDDGSIRYSSILRLNGKGDDGIKIYPTIVKDRIINLILPKAKEKLQIVNTNGAVVFEKDLKNISGTTAITLPALQKRMYIARVIGVDGIKTEKLFIE